MVQRLGVVSWNWIGSEQSSSEFGEICFHIVRIHVQPRKEREHSAAEDIFEFRIFVNGWLEGSGHELGVNGFWTNQAFLDKTENDNTHFSEERNYGRVLLMVQKSD